MYIFILFVIMFQIRGVALYTVEGHSRLVKPQFHEVPENSDSLHSPEIFKLLIQGPNTFS